MSQHGGQTRATCCAQQCCIMLRWHVGIVWPGLNSVKIPNYIFDKHGGHQYYDKHGGHQYYDAIMKRNFSIRLGYLSSHPSETYLGSRKLTVLSWCQTDRSGRDQWEYPRKMERHFPLKPGQPIGMDLTTFYSFSEWVSVKRGLGVGVFFFKIFFLLFSSFFLFLFCFFAVFFSLW